MPGYTAIDEIRPAMEVDIAQRGYYLAKGVLNIEEVEALKADTIKVIEAEGDEYDEHGGHPKRFFSYTQYGDSFFKLLASPAFNNPFSWMLGNDFITHVFTATSVKPHSTSSFGDIHVDNKRFINNYAEGLACIVLLDDFTIENGATYFLPGSHLSPEKPDTENFYRDAIRLLGNAGDVMYFNPRIWHAAGENTTGVWRHSLTIGVSRPHVKQYTDIPESLKDVDLSKYPNTVLKRLGIYAQSAPSIAAYYNNTK
jgi:ectoine hydroxylase-related dioxygenase (phytanoyl-CoA dioxygenase family)